MVLYGLLLAFLSLLPALALDRGPGQAWALTASGPITVSTSNAIIEDLQISGSGDCVTITGSATNITIRANEIGPCTGNGIRINNGTNHKIYDNYIHPQRRPNTCCDTGDGVYIASGVSGVQLQGNVICFGEGNIVTQGANTTVHGNYLCNPQGNSTGDGGGTNGGGRGQQFHATVGASSSTVTNNFLYSCERPADGFGATPCPATPDYPMSARQEDAINFFQSGNALVQNNYLIGGASESGTGMISDTASNNQQFRNNILHNTSHAGIAVLYGTGHVVDGNKVQLRCLGGWSCCNDNGLSVFDLGGGGCSLSLTNNTVSSTRPCNCGTNPTANDCRASTWFGPPSCTISPNTGNVYDAAAEAVLDPIETTNPPPLIPPVPKNCTAVSPYTTQTSPAPCGAAVSSVPTILRVVR